jgi:predicted tellurium resistance membrane protein TerC
LSDKIRQKEDGLSARSYGSFTSVILQSMLVSAIFSIDSVIVAVGLADEVVVMLVAIILSSIVMLLFATPVNNFIQRYPTLKMFGLALLVFIGLMLTGEAFHVEVPKGYLYSAIIFSLLLESLNLQLRQPALKDTTDQPNR